MIPTSTILQLGISSTITQKGVASTISQKGVASTISESGYLHSIPTFISGVVENADSDLVILTFSETLDPASIPATTAFTFSGITGNPTVTNVAISGVYVNLTLSAAVTYGDTVLINYTKPGTNPLQDLDDKDDIASFINQPITNNVLQTYSSQYLLVWNSFTNKPSTADAIIQSTMLDALVAGGYYAKAELLDVFSAHSNTAGESQKNWKNPGTFDPTLVNSPTWTQYAGFTGAVIGTKYVRLNFNPAGNGTLIGQDNICVIIGVGNNVAEGLYDFGGKDGATGDWLTILARSAVDRFYTKCNDTATGTYIANTSSIGHFAASRGTALNYDMHKNLTKTNKTVTSTGTVNIELHACGYNNNGVAAPCTKQLRYVFILSYLTDAEVKAVIAIMETYLDNYGTGLY